MQANESQGVSANVIAPAMLRAEIIAVGTEVLMGEVINSNAAFLSQELANIGVDVFYHTVVGDNPKRIQSIFIEALKRSNLLLVTGGLGPTDDDLTVATLVQLFDATMVRDQASETKIREFFIVRDMPMSPTNLKQADRPQDGEVLLNRMGTAPGLFWDVSKRVSEQGWGEGLKLIAVFPGVPREMKTMWNEAFMPKLQRYVPMKSVLVTRFLKFFGIGESLLAEKLRDLMAQASPTVSPYVGQAEVKIRIAAKASTKAEALALIEPVEVEIRQRVGKYCFGVDDQSLETVLGQALIQHEYKLAVAESCTGGLLSSRLTDVAGSSAYTLLNLVTYSNEAKQSELGVLPETLANFGAVSPQVAAEMVSGLLDRVPADMGIAVTGIAGPTGATPEKPVGMAYLAFQKRGYSPIVKKVTVNPQYERQYIKFWFTQYALAFGRLFLLDLLDADE